MFYVFSATVDGKVYFYKDFSELPVIKDKTIQYHIYPVYEINDKNYTLLRERLVFRNGEFQSDYFHFRGYLKDNSRKEFNSLFISGHGESTNVFANDAAYVHYNIVTKYCYRVNFQN